jgi:hypothetical protein
VPVGVSTGQASRARRLTPAARGWRFKEMAAPAGVGTGSSRHHVATEAAMRYLPPPVTDPPHSNRHCSCWVLLGQSQQHWCQQQGWGRGAASISPLLRPTFKRGAVTACSAARVGAVQWQWHWNGACGFGYSSTAHGVMRKSSSRGSTVQAPRGGFF